MIAYIFPGQGAQYAGMGRALYETSQAARAAFEEADAALGFAISRLCFEGPTEELQLTANTQPAILTMAIAAFRAMLEQRFPLPQFAAGHSLGEYAALVAAEAIDLAAAVKLVRARGTYMQEAVPVGAGAMAAILNADVELIEKACAEAAQGDEVCSPANLNSPNQIVIAGNAEAVDRAIEILKMNGVRRAVKLSVSAPFHCGLMRPAAERLARDLEAIEFRDLRFPIVTNVDARPVTKGAEARAALIRQVASPVRWRETVEWLSNEGVETFVEIGPGKVLSGLVKQTLTARDEPPAFRCLNVEDPASLEAARASLEASDKAAKM
jgi:[acyl-carrier-protein] S-malonyltransferase